MVQADFLTRHKDDIFGTLLCYDRLLLRGTLTCCSRPETLGSYLHAHAIDFRDYVAWAQKLRDQLQDAITTLAAQRAVSIEYLRSRKGLSLDKRIEVILLHRGHHPGLVHIFSALEQAPSFEYRPTQGLVTKYRPVLHYYLYFIDADFGLGFLKLSTFCPFPLMVYLNGHSILAQRLRRHHTPFLMADNAFAQIGDIPAANRMAEAFSNHTLTLQRKLDALVRAFCPTLLTLPGSPSYYWTITQAELSLDILFRSANALQTIYRPLLERLILAVKPEDILSFFARRLALQTCVYDIDSSLARRTLGLRLKHHLGPVSIKVYDKASRILRLECTVNDVRFFSQSRTKPTGSTATKTWAPMRKSIASLYALFHLLHRTLERYLHFLSCIDCPVAGRHHLDHLAEPVPLNGHHYKGFNPASPQDASLFRILLRGEFVSFGITRRRLAAHLPDASPGQLSRLLKRLRLHHILRKVAHHNKYYLSPQGLALLTITASWRELHAIPALDRAA